MGRYRKVDTRIWNDARFGSLSNDGKLAFLFLLTHPHLTSLGAMRATIAGLAAELGWKVERFVAAFDELVGADTTAVRSLVEYDEQASFIGLPNFLKYNQPENPNVIRSWGTPLDLLPECEAKARLIVRVKRCVVDRGEKFVSAWETVSEGLPERYAKPFRKGFDDSGLNSGNGMPNQEQEPEQEQDPKQEPEPKQKGGADAAGVKRFQVPSVEQVRDYCQKRNNNVDPETFVDFYASKGWKIGSGPMKDWQAAIRNWERRNATSQRTQSALATSEDPRGNFAAGQRYLESCGGSQND